MYAVTFKFVDLFAGVGGLSTPFVSLGGECVFASEIDKFAQKTYLANHGVVPHGDICAIKSDEIPNHDLLLGGFPCQPFSAAGKGLGFSDTRGTLFFEIERILKAKMPSAFLLENVKRLLTHDKGKTFEVIKSALRNIGYDLRFKVLNSRDFGLPQNRDRIFLVGSLLGFEDDFFGNICIPKTKTCVGDILETGSDFVPISDKSWAFHLARKKKQSAAGNGFGYSVVWAESPYTNTLRARYAKDGAECLVCNPDDLLGNPRMLTPRECARLQGFPDSFDISQVSKTQAYKQMGNSVSVPVVRAIARVLVPHITNEIIHLTSP